MKTLMGPEAFAGAASFKVLLASKAERAGFVAALKVTQVVILF